MTSNVLPLHFAPSQASSSQNSNVDSYLQYCEVDSLKPSKSESSLIHTYFESPKNGLPCTVVDPLGCHFVLYKVGWKLWSWLTSRRESFSTLTLTYMHSITELSHWKKTSSWIEKSDPDQGKSLTSWLFRCQKDQNFLTRSYVSRCSLGSRVSPVEHTKVYSI